MPFTSQLPPALSVHAAHIRQALDTLLSLMAATPAGCQRVEDRPEYLDRLVTALLQVGEAFEAALLKNDVINPNTWNTQSEPERWARGLVQRGFDKSLDRESLGDCLAQPTDGGTRSVGDLTFFAMMRGCLQMFRDAVVTQIEPEALSTRTDDQRQGKTAELPGTLGELIAEVEQREAADAVNRQLITQYLASGRPDLAQMVSALTARADLRQVPGVERLVLLCARRFEGTGLAAANLRRLWAEVCERTGMPPVVVDELPVGEAADVLEGSQRMILSNCGRDLQETLALDPLSVIDAVSTPAGTLRVPITWASVLVVPDPGRHTSRAHHMGFGPGRSRRASDRVPWGGSPTAGSLPSVGLVLLPALGRVIERTDDSLDRS